MRDSVSKKNKIKGAQHSRNKPEVAFQPPYKKIHICTLNIPNTHRNEERNVRI